MQNGLKDALIKFKQLTVDALMCLEAEDFDMINSLLDSRQGIIEYINTLNQNTEEFRFLCKELGLLELERNLNLQTNIKRAQLRSNIDKVSINRSANVAYNQKSPVDSFFFDKKI